MSENMKTAREVAEDVQGELINGLANLLYDGDGPLESDEQTNDRYAAWLERIWQGEPVRHHALGDAVKRISDAEADRDLLMAATWDVYCWLGYDPDGDKRWHCSPEVAARTVVQCAKEAREFSEEVGDECEEQRERAERAEAAEQDAQADCDRRGERLWRLATEAGWRPGNDADNDATAETHIRERLRDAERAEAELAALRDRARGLVEQATEAAYGAIADEQMLTILPTEHGAKVPPHWRAQAEARATLTVADLRDLLDDDTTGAASGEGEK